MTSLHSAAILTAVEARSADETTIAGGILGFTLMQNAGKTVVEFIGKTYAPCPTLIVCGNGNNGGDGLVIAHMLKNDGWPVTVCSTDKLTSTSEDASKAFALWEKSGGTVHDFVPRYLENHSLIIDALFGTGLNREVSDKTKAVIDAINTSKIPVVAVDIPSGIDATTGAVLGAAIQATHTVTFLRPKLGHVLLPGKMRTGHLHVANIGIDGNNIRSTHFLNQPSLWEHAWPTLHADTHKYTRGHALVMGGNITTTGATRLAATAALRIGAGLVSVGCSNDTLPIYAVTFTAVMTKMAGTTNQLESLLEDERINCVLIGPGYGVGNKTRTDTLHILSHKKSCVLDADVFTSFQSGPKELFRAIQSPVVMTPHEGEFSRLFDIQGDKVTRARKAAEISNAIIVLKGNDTIIASPDGRIVVNNNAPAWLATAGSGDVLAGIIIGLLAQGMLAFEAACAGVWIHSQAAHNFGIGLIAEDLPGQIPGVLRSLLASTV